MALARLLLLSSIIMNVVRHILIATDFGPASERALDQALELAEKFDAKLTLLHVSEPVAYPYPYAIGAHAALPVEALNGMRTRSVQELEATVASARRRRPDAQGVFRDGTAWREIVATAKELRADLVVVGSHGHRGLSHRLLGSVAERVVRSSPIPVLTVRGFWFEDRVDSGRQLAAALEAMRKQSPAVVAISRGGIVVGAEVARAFHASLELLLTDRLETRGVALGAVCDGGMTHFAPDAVHVAVAAEQQTKLISTARARLEEDAAKIRGNACLGDLWRRVVILVSDGLTDPWCPLAAADVIAKMHPESIVFAAPVASTETLSVLNERFPGAVVLHTLRASSEPSAAYRDFHMPSNHALAQLLHENTMGLAARSA